MNGSTKRIAAFGIAAIILIGAIGVSQRAHGDSEMTAEEAARELIVVSGVEGQLVPMMKQFVRLQAQAADNAGAWIDTDILDQWIDENISWSEFEPGFIEMYTDLFTAEELMEIVAFQRTPVGQKSVRMAPLLMERGGQVGLQVVQEKIPALMELLDAQELPG